MNKRKRLLKIASEKRRESERWKSRKIPRAIVSG